MCNTITMYFILMFCAIFLSVCADYNGCKVYRITPSNYTQIEMLMILKDHNKLDFWSSLSDKYNDVDVMVYPEEQRDFFLLLQRREIRFKTIIENVETVVRQENVRQKLAPRYPRGTISFSKYNNYVEINAYLYQLALNYPDTVTLKIIGSTYEKRYLGMIQISTNRSANNPVIFIDAGIHAREWIAPAQALYIIQELVENPANRRMLMGVDWHILPVLNADGYEYTHKKGGNRLWRKTRSPQDYGCIGTDANRNFDFYWGLVGASSNPCSNTYKGPKPFSEIESRHISEYILRYRENIKLYLTFHSYGPYLLYPWGYTSELPENEYELRNLATKVNSAITAAGGPNYNIGTSTNVLYAAAGGSDDWVKGIAEVELSYTIELPGGGESGFDLPANDILKVVRQTFAGIVVFGKYIGSKFRT